LGADAESAPGAEILDDRQISDVKRTYFNASGDINCELSYNAYDDWLVAALMPGTTATPTTWASTPNQTDTTYAAVASGNKFTDSANDFVTNGFAAGMWIKVSGFTGTSTTANGIWYVISVIAGEMAVIGSVALIDDAEGESVTIAQIDDIDNGTGLRYYSIEKEYQDLTTTFEALRGMCVDGMNWRIAPREIITGGFSFIGKEATSETATIGTGYTAATTKTTMSAVDDVAVILENDASYEATEFTINLANNLRERAVIGTLGPTSVGTGPCVVTGTLQAYFTSSTVANKFLNWTSTSIGVMLQDTDGNNLCIDLPQVKYTASRRNAPGQSQDVILDMAWQAYRHATLGYTIRIAKSDA
jgi:hypothetical protein